MTPMLLDTKAVTLSTAQLSAVLASSLDPLVVIDCDGIVCAASDSLERVFGWKPEEFVGRNVKILMPELPHSLHDGYLQKHKRTGRTNLIGVTQELVAIRKNGETFPCELTISRVDSQSAEKPLFSGIIRDMTRHTALEARMRLYSDSLAAIGEAVIVSDREGNMQYINPAASQLTGYSADQLIGRNPRIFGSGTHSREFYEDMWETVLKGRPWSGELTNRRRDGTSYECRLTLSPVCDLKGVVEGFVAIQHDITDRKRSEVQLQDHVNTIEATNYELYHAKKDLEGAVSKLEASNRALDDFAYIASHDRKEPLRGIHNFSIFLLEDYAGKIDADGQSKLKTLCRLTQRLEELINSLLYFSRVGRVDLAVKETSIDDVVDDVIELLSARLDELRIDIRRPDPLPTIRCDTARIGEVFRNLITNEMKYNDKDEKWIEIGLKPERQSEGSEESTGDKTGAGGPTVFFVRDNGIGIREKHLDTIFRMFKRLHGKDKFGGGTGAGMTIVKKIIERHGGTIWIESTVGEGTTFYFTLHEATDHDHDIRD